MAEPSPHIQYRLPYYIANRLLETERQEVEKHLKDCPDCKRRLEELLESNTAGPVSGGLGQPDGLGMSDLAAPPHPPARRRRFPWKMIGSLLAFIIFGVLIWMASQKGDRYDAPPPIPEAPAEAPPPPNIPDTPPEETTPAPTSVAPEEVETPAPPKQAPPPKAEKPASKLSPQKPRKARSLSKSAAPAEGGLEYETAAPAPAPTPARVKKTGEPTLASPKYIDEKLKPNPLKEWKGLRSGVTKSRTVVVRSEEAWLKLWREHTRKSRESLPEVDFSQYVVIGVFGGQKPKGYSIEILGSREGTNTMIVYYREFNPPSDALTTESTIQPYNLRVIPKTSLPIEFKSF